MKEFMLLLRAGKPMSAKTPDELKQEQAEWNAYMGGLMQSGNFVGGLPFKSGGSFVSASGVVDEPVKAAEGIVGGYLMFKAESLEQAIEFAKACPHVAYEGNIEVRELGPMPAM